MSLSKTTNPQSGDLVTIDLKEGKKMVYFYQDFVDGLIQAFLNIYSEEADKEDKPWMFLHDHGTITPIPSYLTAVLKNSPWAAGLCKAMKMPAFDAKTQELAGIHKDVDSLQPAIEKILTNYSEIHTAIENLRKGNRDEVLKFLKRISGLNLEERNHDGRRTREDLAMFALWKTTKQAAWQRADIEDITAYIAHR